MVVYSTVEPGSVMAFQELGLGLLVRHGAHYPLEWKYFAIAAKLATLP